MVKRITKILIVIISLLLVYIAFIVGSMIMRSKDDESTQNYNMDTASPMESTLIDDEQGGNATSLDAHSEDVYKQYIQNVVNTGIYMTTWSGRPEKELPSKAAIDMEIILQHPELPTGCESVALTMVLKYYGFDLEKTTIAKDYLVYSNNFVEGYVGNPFTTSGAGVYSPGLARTARNYLEAQGSDMKVANVTNSQPEKLYRYVSEGVPVIVWNTVYFLDNQPSGQYNEWMGKKYQWDNCEHCVVLTGYDLDENIVIVHDPVEGIMERDADAFWERYENLGSMAIVIE